MSFSDIIGQPRAVRVLKKALSTGNMPHAYLFYGSEGVGRFRTAITLAAAMFCRAAKEDACGTCSDCTRMARESHPGLSVVRPQVKNEAGEWVDDPVMGEIRIDRVREIQRWFAVRSFEGGWRICIFDGAEKINDNAANALLKTLEEPPPDSLLVLISPGRAQLPATVVSRCQGVYFAPVSPEEIAGSLADRLRESSETVSLVAALAEGSVGKALRMDTEWVSGERRQWIERLIRYVCSRGGEATVDLARDLAGCDRPEDVLNLFLSWYRDLVIYKALGDSERLMNRDLIDEIQEMSCLEDVVGWTDRVRVLWRTKADLEGDVRLNVPLLMEDMLFRLAGRRGEC